MSSKSDLISKIKTSVGLNCESVVTLDDKETIMHMDAIVLGAYNLGRRDGKAEQARSLMSALDLEKEADDKNTNQAYLEKNYKL